MMMPSPPWAAGRAGAVAGRGAAVAPWVRPVPIVSGGARPPGHGRAAADEAGGLGTARSPSPVPAGPVAYSAPPPPFPLVSAGRSPVPAASPRAGRGRHPTSGVRCCWIPLPWSPCPCAPSGCPGTPTHPPSPGAAQPPLPAADFRNFNGDVSRGLIFILVFWGHPLFH